MRYVVEIEPGVWLSKNNGWHPGATVFEHKAKKYNSALKAGFWLFVARVAFKRKLAGAMIKEAKK